MCDEISLGVRNDLVFFEFDLVYFALILCLLSAGFTDYSERNVSFGDKGGKEKEMIGYRSQACARDEWKISSTVTVKIDRKKGEIEFLMDGKLIGKPLPISRRIDWFPGIVFASDGIQKYQIL